jgi:hypothetical protein
MMVDQNHMARSKSSSVARLLVFSRPGNNYPSDSVEGYPQEKSPRVVFMICM